MASTVSSDNAAALADIRYKNAQSALLEIEKFERLKGLVSPESVRFVYMGPGMIQVEPVNKRPRLCELNGNHDDMEHNDVGPNDKPLRILHDHEFARLPLTARFLWRVTEGLGDWRDGEAVHLNGLFTEYE
eukprot:111520-Rhodomonas_salina.1